MKLKNKNVATDTKDKEPRTTHSRAIQNIGHTLLSALACTSPLSLTAYAMIQEKTVNPASALKYSAQRSLGTRDYCPKAPAEEKTDAYKLFSIAAMEKDERFSNQLQEAKAKAKERGMHFADTSKIYGELRSSTTINEATGITSNHMKSNYGFPVQISTSTRGIQLEDYKTDLNRFITYTSILPTELIQSAEITRLDLSTSLHAKSDNAGTFSTDNQVVTIDTNYIGEPGTFLHEVLGHGLHQTACSGNYMKDRAITSENPKNFRYTHRSKSPGYTYDPETKITASAYGETDHTEDVAEITREFLYGGYVFETVGTTSPASEKLEIILDRMDTLVPGSVEYLATINDRGLTAYMQSEFRRTATKPPLPTSTTGARTTTRPHRPLNTHPQAKRQP